MTNTTCTQKHVCAAHTADHVHGPTCGHATVQHDGHTDYLVDDHLHHADGDHCDDHGRIIA